MKKKKLKKKNHLTTQIPPLGFSLDIYLIKTQYFSGSVILYVLPLLYKFLMCFLEEKYTHLFCRTIKCIYSHFCQHPTTAVQNINSNPQPIKLVISNCMPFLKKKNCKYDFTKYLTFFLCRLCIIHFLVCFLKCAELLILWIYLWQGWRIYGLIWAMLWFKTCTHAQDAKATLKHMIVNTHMLSHTNTNTSI